MISAVTKLLQPIRDLERDKLKRDKFALLAMVGHRKREASRYQEEAEFWSGCVIETLAVLRDAMDKLRKEHPTEEGDKEMIKLMSRHSRLIRQLTSYFPPDTTSQLRLSALLESVGLERVTASTEEGYVFLSSDLILENVERIIEATKAENPKP